MPFLFKLYWLLVCFISLYNILFHTFKVLNGTEPLNLSDLIQKYISVKLKSSTAMNGEKSVKTFAPRLWNRLLNHVKSAPSKEMFCNVYYLFKLVYQ